MQGFSFGRKDTEKSIFLFFVAMVFFSYSRIGFLGPETWQFFLCFADVTEAIGVLNNYLEEGRSMRAALPFSVNHTHDYESNPMIVIMMIIAIITVVV